MRFTVEPHGPTYSFSVSLEEHKGLPYSSLETDLLDTVTGQPVGKKASLEVGEPQVGEADCLMVPDGALYDKAKKVRVIISKMQYDQLGLFKEIDPRIAFGDLIVFIEDAEASRSE